MKKLLNHLLLLFISFALLQANPKSFSSPFSSFQFGCHLNNQSATDLSRYWSSNDGFHFFYETPFYAGNISAGLAYTPHSSKRVSIPDYQSYFIYAGWMINMALLDNIYLKPGVRLGNYLMNFDGVSGQSKRESEICLGWLVQIHYPIAQKIDANIEYTQQQVFTYRSFKISIFRVGMTIELQKPQWFDKFLK